MKVVIDAGHGGSTLGARANGLIEKEETLKVALIVRALLMLDHDIIMTREDDIDMSLMQRVRIANFAEADLFISLHCNAFTENDVYGIRTYYHKHDERWLGQLFKTQLDNIYPYDVSKNGLQRRDYYVLQKTNMPAVLLELGFLTCLKDATWVKNNLKSISLAIAKGVWQAERHF